MTDNSILFHPIVDQIIVNVISALLIAGVSYIFWKQLKSKIEFSIFSSQTVKGELYKRKLDAMEKINRHLNSIESYVQSYTSPLQTTPEENNVNVPEGLEYSFNELKKEYDAVDVFIDDELSEMVSKILEKSLEATVKRQNAATRPQDKNYVDQWQVAVKIAQQDIPAIKKKIKAKIRELSINL